MAESADVRSLEALRVLDRAYAKIAGQVSEGVAEVDIIVRRHLARIIHRDGNGPRESGSGGAGFCGVGDAVIRV